MSEKKDRHASSDDRHRSRLQPSGAENLRKARDREKAHLKILSKTPQLTGFFPVKTNTVEPSDSSESVETESDTKIEEEPIDILAQDDIEKYNNCTRIDSAHTSTDLSASIEVGEKKLESVESLIQNFSKCDISKWPENMKDFEDYIIYWFKSGSDQLQNCDESLFKEKSFKQEDTDFRRTCQKSMFVRTHKNGEIIKRKWLCFSPINGKVYCLFCKLFSDCRTQFSHGGFCDWKNAVSRLISHETSPAHLKAMTTFEFRAGELGRIDFEMREEFEKEKQYWREVILRMVDVICFISERSLSFRGTDEIIGSPHNGNYLGILELMSEYDEFLDVHIKTHSNQGRGHVNYLSSTTCNELRRLIAQRVLDEIIRRVKISRYYGFTLDSTKDQGNIDQLVLVIRYIETNGDPVERFVTFMPNQGHKALDMFKGFKAFLQTNELKLNDARSQSHDNASNMSGKNEGLQALVRKENPLAVWVPCMGHSINLVGTDAMNSCIEAKLFFSTLEGVYVFFTSSTERYAILIACLKQVPIKAKEKPLLVPKRIDTTRFSSRSDATKAFIRGYKPIMNKLGELVTENCEANGLFTQMEKLETAIYALVWNDILERVNIVSKSIQSPKLDLNTAIGLLSSLKSFIEQKRESFSVYESKAMDLCGNDEYVAQTRRKRQRNIRLTDLNSPNTPEVDLTPSEAFRIKSCLPVIDQFTVSLGDRISAYTEIYELFGFLKDLLDISADKIEQYAKKLCDFYTDDLDENLGTELLHFKEFCREFIEDKEEQMSFELFMLKLLIRKNVKASFPNVEILLKIYLCIMTTNCSGERSFSKMKLIKNRLSASMSEGSLIDRTILSTEYDVLRSLDISDIISDFADKKARKKMF